MKRVGYIYEKVYKIENIKLAIMKASLGKREREEGLIKLVKNRN